MDKLEKKSKSKNQREMFLELADMGTSAIEVLHKAVLDPSLLATVAENESKGDKIRDELVLLLTTSKSGVPLLLDKMKLIRRLDDVLDSALRASQNMRVYLPVLEKAEKESLQSIAENTWKGANILKEIIDLLFTSFEDAERLVEDLAELRDTTRDEIYRTKEEFFQSEDNWKRYMALDVITSRFRDLFQQMKEVGEIVAQITIRYTQ